MFHMVYERDSKNYTKIAAEPQKARVLSKSVTQQVSNDKPTENDKNARIVIGQWASYYFLSRQQINVYM